MLGYSHEELRAGFTDGTFWPIKRPRFPYSLSGPIARLTWEDRVSGIPLCLEKKDRTGPWDVPNAPPIAPGGGNAWHMGCHFAYMAVMAALVYRTVAGRGQYIDASIHEACALTTESAIANYIYRGEVLQRHTGRHHAAGPTPHTQFRASDGNYVCALVGGRLNPKYIKELADLLDTNGMAGDLRDPKYQDQAVINANTSHIIDGLVASFIASLPAEEI